MFDGVAPAHSYYSLRSLTLHGNSSSFISNGKKRLTLSM
jgi:hypothetical protein